VEKDVLSENMESNERSLAIIIRDNPRMKGVFHALLIDKRTPEKVFMELFGVSISFVTWYKNNYDGLWIYPRIMLYDSINSIMDIEVKKLYMDVYNGGWEIVDALFNHGKNINAADLAITIIKIAAAKAVKDAINGEKLSPVLIGAAKSMVSSAREYNSIDSGDVDEEWEMMVEELSAREKMRHISKEVGNAMEQVMNVLESKKPELKNKEEENRESSEGDNI